MTESVVDYDYGGDISIKNNDIYHLLNESIDLHLSFVIYIPWYLFLELFSAELNINPILVRLDCRVNVLFNVGDGGSESELTLGPHLPIVVFEILGCY